MSHYLQSEDERKDLGFAPRPPDQRAVPPRGDGADAGVWDVDFTRAHVPVRAPVDGADVECTIAIADRDINLLIAGSDVTAAL